MTDAIKKVTIGNATLYCCDCREIIKDLTSDAIITDPVWPNAPAGMFEISESPFDLLKTSLQDAVTDRLVIVLRFDSDPRFLQAVPANLKFLRLLNLPYNLPSYVGRTLSGIEHAYAFGNYPKAKRGKRIIPGIAPSVPYKRKDGNPHPCPRNEKHMDWLIHHWSNVCETVLDPFMGSGTTGVSAVRYNRKFIGIEINQKYFDYACKRIEQASEEPYFF